MKLDASRLAIALGGTTAIFWTICSALVALFSGTMASMTGRMLHMNASQFMWSMTFPGFLAGLILWTVCAALAGGLIGWIYNAVGGSNSINETVSAK